MSAPNLTRRRFFRLLARETVVQIEEARGRPQLRLDELDRLAEQELVQLAPAVVPGVTILVEGDGVCARIPGSAQPVLLFQSDTFSLAVFNRFNGRMPLGQIAHEVSNETGWEYDHTFRTTREIFLRLVHLRVCAPMNAFREEM